MSSKYPIEKSYYFSYFYFWLYEKIIILCELGDVSVVQFVYNRTGPQERHQVQIIMHYGHMHLKYNFQFYELTATE